MIKPNGFKVKVQNKATEDAPCAGDRIVVVCSACHRVRDSQGRWRKVEPYFLNLERGLCSHGLCPECAVLLYPEYVRR